MANGTIAFDTLTTSDSVNTGTEKSIDTSYIYNGVAKAWVNYDQKTDNAIDDSFNTSSVSDESTGHAHWTMSVTFANTTGCMSGCTKRTSQPSIGGSSGELYGATNRLDVFTTNTSGSLADAEWTAIAHGDLA